MEKARIEQFKSIVKKAILPVLVGFQLINPSVILSDEQSKTIPDGCNQEPRVGNCLVPATSIDPYYTQFQVLGKTFHEPHFVAQFPGEPSSCTNMSIDGKPVQEGEWRVYIDQITKEPVTGNLLGPQFYQLTKSEMASILLEKAKAFKVLEPKDLTARCTYPPDMAKAGQK